jgi:transglutaminase-like putative cysteine protease
MVQSDSFKIRSLAARVTNGKTGDGEKALAIHDWVAANIDYDTWSYFNEYRKKKPFTRQYDALSTLASGSASARPSAICEGYATLTAALFRASGIPARVVVGIVNFSGTPSSHSCAQPDHAWVEAWIQGHWVPFDTSSDAGGVDQITEIFTRDPSRHYLNPTLFNATHVACSTAKGY